MIKYKFIDRKVIAYFTESWLYSLSNLFAKRGINERKFIEKYLSRRTKLFGAAKCHPNDEYNPDYGMALAKADLIKNYKNTIHKLAKLIRDKRKSAYDGDMIELSTISAKSVT